MAAEQSAGRPAALPEVLLLGSALRLADLQPRGNARLAILLFWAAPSTCRAVSGRLGVPCADLTTLVGGISEWRDASARAALERCDEIVAADDLGARRYALEGIVRDVEWRHVAMRVLEHARAVLGTAAGARLVVHCECGVPPNVSDLLRSLGAHVERGGKDGTTARPAFARRINRLRALARDVLGGKPTESARVVGNWVDRRLRVRSIAGSLLPGPVRPLGGVTFFTSYANNTRTLMSIESAMPGEVHWLCLGHGARAVLPPDASTSMLWRHQERFGAGGVRARRRRGLPDGSLRTMDGSYGREWRSVHAQIVSRSRAAFAAYLDTARPTIIGVANHWGVEGCLAQVAREAGIPVLEVMHGTDAFDDGITGLLDPVADLVVVPHPAFAPDASGPQRRRPLVCTVRRLLPTATGSARTEPAPSEAGKVPRLTVISSPFDLLPEFSAEEWAAGLQAVVGRARRATGCTVVLRPHPLERGPGLGTRWYEDFATAEGVVVDAEEDLAGAIAATDVALTVHSTLIVDCVESGASVVTPGWVRWRWFQAFRDANPGSIALPADFPEMAEVVIALLRRGPRSHEANPKLRESWRTERARLGGFVRNLAGTSTDRAASHEWTSPGGR